MTSGVRKKDTGESGNRGEFGTIARQDADVQVRPTSGNSDLIRAGLVERFGFDVRNADPVDFDERAAEAGKELAKAHSRLRGRLDEMHRAIGDRRDTRRAWGTSDDQMLEAARDWLTLADGGAASEATGAEVVKADEASGSYAAIS